MANSNMMGTADGYQTPNQRMASKLYGGTQDKGTPVTQTKRKSIGDGAPRKVKLKPKKATQTDPRGGV